MGTILVVIIGLLTVILGYYQYPSAVLLLAGLLPAYLLRVHLFGLPTNIFELMVGLVFVTGLVQLSVRKGWVEVSRAIPRSIYLGIACFLFAAVLSTIISGQKIVSLGILKSWIITPILFGWLVYGQAKSEQSRAAFLNILVWSGFITALYGLPQVFFLHRIQSIYDVPNSLALWLVPILVVAVWLRYWWRVAVLGLALLAAQSAGGLVAVAISLAYGVFKWANKRQRKRGLSLIGMVLVLALLFFTFTGRLAYLLQPITTGMHNSISVREQLWQGGVSLVYHHPLLGVGLGQFEPAYQTWLHQRFFDYQTCTTSADMNTKSVCGNLPLSEFVFRDPHNFLLAFWLNMGLLGLISFITINTVALRQSLFTSTTSLTHQAAFLGLVALLIFGLTDTIYWKNDLSALYFLLLVILLVSSIPAE